MDGNSDTTLSLPYTPRHTTSPSLCPLSSGYRLFNKDKKSGIRGQWDLKLANHSDTSRALLEFDPPQVGLS